MAIPGVGYAAWVWFRHRPASRQGDVPKLGNPLSLSTAIKFAVLYSLIAFGVKVIGEEGWTQGLLPLSFVSGLTDMDAISLSIARDHGGDQVGPVLATRAVVLAAVSNTLLKAGLAIVLGSLGLRRRIGVVLGTTILIGLAWLLIGGAVPAGEPGNE
jgi:uncharacterized membrane protein (DUF4010 family)